MHLFSSEPLTLFIFAVLLTILLPPTVRSNPNLIKLPYDQVENDLCPFNSKQEACHVKCF
ncbi:hypothetical protein PHJA_001062800 [Phtheirospermum japonicum]|uniref:Uncharacterized protein n=1 Tax=Phtheirospermum japonicum TaxID=374723 RepID=A0A830C4I3_9LAMI|nr:hypothetical protein PHJA_001062800 [Phtheirospermum japonicum]